MARFSPAAAGLVSALRPKHWIKNVFVFAPLFFSGRAAEIDALLSVIVVFFGFNAAASAIYLFNDIFDAERDRVHPDKRHRPIASGTLPVRAAIIACVILALISVLISALISPPAAFVVIGYIGLNVAYSIWLKHIVILDVFSIAIGFLLRVLAGAVAINVHPTPWLLIATFLIALFLALAKRREELTSLENQSDNHRPVLTQYTTALADELISVVTPVTLLAYLLYTLDAETKLRFQSDWLYVTGIFVVFGVFRYLYLVHRKNLGGSPTDLVLKDIPLLGAVVGWGISFILIIYF